MTSELKNKNVLLIICGGIAAYKSLELIRLLKKDGANVTPLMTKASEEFITPLSVAALSENEVHTDLWSLKDEAKMRHIRLTRDADHILIAPASANLIAKISNGIADDLASTTLLASDKPALIAPAMNHMMWHNQATQENIKKIKEYGHFIIGPDEGDMACGEHGLGPLSEPAAILEALKKKLHKPLNGYKALVTSGPTYEPIDPVRFIGNRSSGKQGHAIAAALKNAGADVTLITGPVNISDPHDVKTIHIETATQMLNAAENNIDTDIAVFAAAVSDWSPEHTADQKIKKNGNSENKTLSFIENPDILKTVSNHKKRPKLVIGFAAETENLQEHAKAKLDKKGCDWILANLVAQNDKKVFGEDENHIYLIRQNEISDWKPLTKSEIAEKLSQEIAIHFGEKYT